MRACGLRALSAKIGNRETNTLTRLATTSPALSVYMPTYGRRASQRLASGVDESQQLTPRTSQRQTKQTGTNSGRRTRRVAEDRPATPEPADEQEEDEESSEEEQSSEPSSRLRPAPLLSVPVNVQKATDSIAIDEIEQKGAELARYALACEYQRMPVRGEHVRREVLVDNKYSRVFNSIFNEAQKILQKTFGYHMVEVRPKGADNVELEKQAEAAIREASSQANGLRSRNKEREASPGQEGRTNSNIWVLRSALPPKVTKALVNVSNSLALDESSRSTANSRQQTGESAISWSKANQQGGEMGLLYIILGLILVNGRTVTDFTLMSCLKRLRLPLHDVLPTSLRGTGPAPGLSSSGTQSTQTQARQRAKQGTLDGFLTAMIRQSYLEKQRADASADGQARPGNGTQTRGRRARPVDDENTVWEWRWGNRSEIEIGEQRIASFMADIFLDPSASHDAPDDDVADASTRAVDRAILKKRKRSLLENIASVAGSALIE